MLDDSIQKKRKESGLTQEQLANKLGVTRQTVSKWENGVSVPDADVLSNMAVVFDVSVSELLGVLEEKSTSEEYTRVLASINEELAERNRRKKAVVKILKVVLILIGIGLGALAVYVVFWMGVAATM